MYHGFPEVTSGSLTGCTCPECSGRLALHRT